MALRNANPALKCRATFTRSVRHEYRRILLSLMSDECGPLFAALIMPIRVPIEIGSECLMQNAGRTCGSHGCMMFKAILTDEPHEIL
jgi:plasmid stability protein